MPMIVGWPVSIPQPLKLAIARGSDPYPEGAVAFMDKLSALVITGQTIQETHLARVA